MISQSSFVADPQYQSLVWFTKDATHQVHAVTQMELLPRFESATGLLVRDFWPVAIHLRYRLPGATGGRRPYGDAGVPTNPALVFIPIISLRRPRNGPGAPEATPLRPSRSALPVQMPLPPTSQPAGRQPGPPGLPHLLRSSRAGVSRMHLSHHWPPLGQGVGQKDLVGTDGYGIPHSV